MSRLPDIGALGARQAPVNRKGIATQDTTAEGRGAAQLGQVIGQVGGELADEYNKQIDNSAVMAGRRGLNDFDRDKVFDPENGAITKRGKDAFDLPKTLPAEFDKTAAEIRAGMTNGRQQRAFDDIVASRRAQLGAWVDGHVLKQREVFNEGQYQADLKSFADRAVLYAGDPAKVATELAIQQDRTISYLKGKGQSEEYIAAAVRDNSSRVHTSVIASMLADGNASGAKDYLTKNAAGMGAEDVQRVRESLKEGLAREKSQAFADQMADKPLAEALTEARKRFTGVEETAAVAELKTRAAEKEAIKATAFKDNADSAWKVITNGGSKNQIPIGVWNGLGGEEQRQINDYVEAKWRRAKADAEGKKEEDWGTYMMLRDMALQDPVKFNDPQTLLRYEPHLSKAQMTTLVNTRNAISKDDMKAMQAQETIKRAINGAKDQLEKAGVDLTPGDNEAKKKKLAEFTGSLDMALQAATQEKGRALDADEAKRIAMNMVRDGIVQGSGFFFDDRKKAYQVTDADGGKAFVYKRFGDIPAAAKSELTARYRTMKNRGTMPLSGSDELEIEKAYTRGVNEGRYK